MGRKVSVGLEADVTGFIKPVEASARATESLDDKIESLDHSLNKIPADAAKAGAALKLLGGDVNNVGDKIGSLGDKNTGLAVLDAKIRNSRTEVKKLAEEFVKTGDVDVFHKLGEAEGKLRGLQDTRKKLAAALTDGVEDTAKVMVKKLSKGGEEAGGEFAKLFSSGLQGGLSNPLVGPILLGLGAAVAVPLAAFVGAAIGGAITAAGAAAGAGLGLAGAWMGDPVKYSALWNRAIDGIQQRWMKSSAAFGDELEDVLGIVDRMFQGLPIEKILALSQSFVRPLAGGLAGGLAAAADGFADLLSKAQPVVDRLGPELANLGHDVGDSLRMIGLGTEGGADALGDLTNAIGYTIKAIGLLILGFEMAYKTGKEWAHNLGDIGKGIVGTSNAMGLQHFAEGLIGIDETGIGAAKSLRGVGEAGHYAADRLAATAVEAAKTAASADGLNDALTKTRSTMLSMADADLALAQGWIDLRKELDEGTKTLKLNRQEGIDNTKAIVGQIEAAERSRLKQIELTGDIDAANAKYAENVAAIRAAALAAGFNADEVDKLINKYAGLPPAKETKITAPGLSTTLEQGIALGNVLNRIDGTYVATVKAQGLSQVLADAARAAAALARVGGAGQSRGSDYHAGGIRRAQVGMILPPSDPGTVLAAEPQTGGEALIPMQGISQGRAMSLMQQVGAGYGLRVSAGGGGALQTVRHIVDVTFGGEVLRRIIINGASDRGMPVDQYLGIA